MLSRREPQQDRSRATRECLLDATIESLAEVGWYGTSVVGVAGRAGVSRGAAQHHFTTRDALVLAAVDRVSGQLAARLRSQLPATTGEDRILHVLEAMIGIWTDSVGQAAMQLWIAAAADPGLRALVLPMEERFSRDMQELAMELLQADGTQPNVEEAVRLTLDVVRGIGLTALVRKDLRGRRKDLARWAAVLASTPGVGR